MLSEPSSRLAAEYQAILNATHDGIIVIDQRGRITTFSAAAEKITGWTATELVGRSLDVLLPPDIRDQHHHMVAAFSVGQAKSKAMGNWRSVSLRRKDGSLIPIMVNLSRYETSGTLVMTAVIRDMTQSAVAEDEIEQLRRDGERARLEESRAEAASQAKSQFLAAMSHELRTPLNAISNYATLLKEELADGGREDLVADVEKIDAANRHLLTLISDVLDLSKIEAGRMELHSEPLDLRELLDEIKIIAEPLVHANNSKFFLVTAGESWYATLDAMRLRQILLNLLSNAAKFTKNGMVELIVISGADFTFLVRDNGIGMSADQVARLFNPFTQADSSVSKRFGGTGLGLHLTRQLVEMMGGRITVASSQGQGTAFTVTLPRSQLPITD